MAELFAELDSKEIKENISEGETFGNPLTDEFILTLDKIGIESSEKKLDPNEDIDQTKTRQLVDDTEGNELGKNLTLLHVTSLAIGQIIGSGIFISPNEVVKQVGSPGLSIIIWLLGGLLSLCGALAFGELGAMYPKSGGEYQYLKLTYGRLMGFVNLWVSVIRNSLSIAVIALTFSTYFISMFIEPDQALFELIKKCVAAAAIAVIIVLCLYSTKYSLYVVNTFTVLKLGAVLMIIVLGAATLCQGNFENIKPGFEGTNMDVGLWSNALMSSLWAYNGWNSIGIIASEVKNPTKNLPRALIITGLVMTLLYVITNLSYHVLLSTEDLVARESIAIVVGETFFGQWGEGAGMFGKYFFAISVAFSTFGALVSVILSWSRLPFAAAQEEMFPSCFSLVLKRSGTPVVSLLFTGLGAFICVWPSNIFSLITYVGFLSWLFWGLCFAGVIVLRWKYPDIERPFRVPIAVPVIAVLSSLYLVIGLFYAMPVSSGVCVACSLIAIPVYYGYVDTDNRCSAWMENLTDKLKQYLHAE